MQPQQILDEQQFIEKYWYPNTQVITVKNPTSTDYVFQATVDATIDVRTGKPRPEARQYMVKAGGTERFPGSIANMYLDQMSKILAQTDNRLDRMIDFSERAKYYDQLTVDNEDLIAAYTPNPTFNDLGSTQVDETPDEVPFAAAQETVPTPNTGETYTPKRMGRPPKATTA